MCHLQCPTEFSLQSGAESSVIGMEPPPVLIFIFNRVRTPPALYFINVLCFFSFLLCKRSQEHAAAFFFKGTLSVCLKFSNSKAMIGIDVMNENL